MFAKRLDELTERKRHIVAETGLYRSLVELECATLRVRFNSALTGIQTGSPQPKVGLMAGFRVARRLFGLRHWISTALVVWRWGKEPSVIENKNRTPATVNH